MPPKRSLHIGVLVLPPVQLLDLAPVDLFHMMSKQYLRDCNMPRPFLELGLDSVDIQYIGEFGPATPVDTTVSYAGNYTSGNATVAEMTANLAIRLTCNFESANVQPGQLDVLFVPGPDPKLKHTEAAKDFIRSHAACAGTTVMSVCTGVIPLAQSGILEGRSCTGPRPLLGMFLRKDFPGAKWIEKRWAFDPPTSVDVVGRGRVVDRCELWTAGGITNGQDMVSAYLRRTFTRELVDLVIAMADVGGRAQDYDSGAAADGMWWGWLLLRSWVGVLVGSGGGTRDKKSSKKV